MKFKFLIRATVDFKILKSDGELSGYITLNQTSLNFRFRDFKPEEQDKNYEFDLKLFDFVLDKEQA